VPTQQMESNPLSKQNRNATIRPSYMKADDADRNTQFTCPLTVFRITLSVHAHKNLCFKSFFNILRLRFPAGKSD
jgi:hypothetical protein